MKRRGNPVGRVVGAVLTWALVAGAAAFVFRTASDLTTIGSCAEGGPYVIAQHCPTSTYTLLPIGIVAFLLSFLVAGVLGCGFGASPWAAGLPLLLGGSAVADVITVAFNLYAWPSLIFAALLIGAVIPLIRTRVKNGRGRQYFIGDATIGGRPFPWADTAIGLDTAEGREPTSADWLAGIGISAIGALIGLAIALPWALG